MHALIRIAYVSRASLGLHQLALSRLLLNARSSNDRLGVTGFLLYDAPHFFQVLEGPAEVVSTLFERIRNDPRHQLVVCLSINPLTSRAFSVWATASTEDNHCELGANELFLNDAKSPGLSPPQAQKLLRNFLNRLQRISAPESVESRGPSKPTADTPRLEMADADCWLSRWGVGYSYQPVVDTFARKVVSYEALIRGACGEPAFEVFGAVPPDQLYKFDAEGRVAAIERAAQLGISCDLNLNFMPQSAFVLPGALDGTIEAAQRFCIPLNRIIIEVTESEAIQDHGRFVEFIDAYRSKGMRIAMDDFGAGHSGLKLLSELRPDQIKIDIDLVRQIEIKSTRQSIVRAIISLCRELQIDVVAEGIESLDQLRWLENEGVHLFQGYFLARPGFDCLPNANFPDLRKSFVP